MRLNPLTACCGLYISATLIFWQSGLYLSFAQGYGYGYGYGYEDNIAGQQRSALVSFYNALGGEQWHKSDGWLSKLSQCSWFGVSCLDGVVTTIALPDNNLVGKLPSALSSIATLRHLTLEGNLISGTLPDLELQLLETLDLSRNQLSGPLVQSYFKFPRLSSLKLDTNLISGELPFEASSATSLKLLSLSDNQVTGTIPASFSRLSQLESINLSHNKFSGSFPDVLFELKNLRVIEINDNEFTGHLPSQFSNLTKLEVLNLANNRFFGAFPDLSENIRLRVLVSGNNRFFSPLPDWLDNPTLELVDTTGALNQLPTLNIFFLFNTGKPLIDSDGKAGEIVPLVGSLMPGDGAIVGGGWYANNKLISGSLTDSVRLDDGNIELKLEAVDDLGQVAFATKIIQINSPVYPTVRITNGSSRYFDSDGQIGESISISGIGDDLDGTIVSYAWTVDGAYISEGSDVTLALDNGASTIGLTVTDNVGLTATQTLETFVEPPVYISSEIWPQSFNGTYPDDSFGLPLNNIGIFESDTGMWRTCVNILNSDGTRSNVAYDANFTVLSVEEGKIQLNDLRPFNILGTFTDYLELPDCSGSYDTASNTYTDFVSVGNSIYSVNFRLESSDDRIFSINTYQELEAKF